MDNEANLNNKALESHHPWRTVQQGSHQQFLQMTTALHQLTNQFCAATLLHNAPQNLQNIWQIRTQETFHLG
uniref:Acylamino-acid-releasing enzyme n=1 Tax=Rhizophora mucronata TaxID=61149 RepID=A0A2P2LK35_RHIMU